MAFYYFVIYYKFTLTSIVCSERHYHRRSPGRECEYLRIDAFVVDVAYSCYSYIVWGWFAVKRD